MYLRFFVIYHSYRGLYCYEAVWPAVARISEAKNLFGFFQLEI